MKNKQFKKIRKEVNKAKTLMVVICSIIFLSLSFSLTVAEKFSYGITEELPINYSNIIINETANNSHYWQGLVPSDLDGFYLAIEGSNANQNIDVSPYNFSTDGTIRSNVLRANSGLFSADGNTGIISQGGGIFNGFTAGTNIDANFFELVNVGAIDIQNTGSITFTPSGDIYNLYQIQSSGGNTLDMSGSTWTLDADLNMSENNLTADYFIGDGSYLTGVASGVNGTAIAVTGIELDGKLEFTPSGIYLEDDGFGGLIFQGGQIQDDASSPTWQLVSGTGRVYGNTFEYINGVGEGISFDGYGGVLFDGSYFGDAGGDVMMDSSGVFYAGGGYYDMATGTTGISFPGSGSLGIDAGDLDLSGTFIHDTSGWVDIYGQEDAGSTGLRVHGTGSPVFTVDSVGNVSMDGNLTVEGGKLSLEGQVSSKSVILEFPFQTTKSWEFNRTKFSGTDYDFILNYNRNQYMGDFKIQNNSNDLLSLTNDGNLTIGNQDDIDGELKISTNLDGGKDLHFYYSDPNNAHFIESDANVIYYRIGGSNPFYVTNDGLNFWVDKYQRYGISLWGFWGIGDDISNGNDNAWIGLKDDGKTYGQASRLMTISDWNDRNTDWQNPLYADPTFCFQSSDNSSVDQRMCLQHDQTDGVLWVDSGEIRLDNSTKVVGDLNVTGDYYQNGQQGFTGHCVNVTYSGGIAISCND